MNERGGVSLRSSFAQRILVILSAVVLIAMVSLAAEIGVLGERAQALVRALWHPLWSIYQSHKGSFDLVILIVGTSVPGLAGGLAILRKFYYAEIMLPKRMQELAEGEKLGHLAKRPEVMAYVQAPFDRRDFLVPMIFANPFAKLGSFFGYVSTRNQARQFATSVGVFEDQIGALRERVQDIENQKVTAHLLRGLFFEAEARDFEARSKDWRDAMVAAQSEFAAALALRDSEIEVLEGASRLARALEDETEELRLLSRLVAVTDQKRHPLQHARALRKIAEIQDRKGTTTGWSDARARLVTAIRVLDPRVAFGTIEVVEMATIQALYGEVQTKREKFSTARTALERSAALFGTVSGEEGTAGKLRAQQALRILDEASGDQEAPGDD